MTVTTEARRADAATAHRDELLARRRTLTAGHRADVAAVLGLARLACADELAGEVDRLRTRWATRIDRARPDPDAVPAALAADVAGLGRRLDTTFDEHTAPGLRRIAARLCPGAPLLPIPPTGRAGAVVLRDAVPGCPAYGRARRLRVFAADPRLLGAVAGVPVLAIRGAGPATVLVVAGLLLVLGCVGRARLLAVERARLHAHLARTVAAVGAAVDREVQRRLIRLEAAVVAALDRAVGEQRSRTDAALAGTARGAAR